MDRKIEMELVIWIVFIVFLIGSISAVTYKPSTNVFDAEITYIENQKLPNSIILNIDKKVNETLDFDIKIVYRKQDLVVATEKMTCLTEKCEFKVELKKSFFDTHEVTLRTKHEGDFYEKELKFRLEMPEFENSLITKKTYVYDGSSKLDITGKLNLEREGEVIIEARPRGLPDKAKDMKMYCSRDCNFNLSLTSDIVYGNYDLFVYLKEETLASEFRIIEPVRLTNIQEKNLSRFIDVGSQERNVRIYNLFGEVRDVTVSGEIDSRGIRNVDTDGIRENVLNVRNKIKSIPSLNEFFNESEKVTLASIDSAEQIYDLNTSRTLRPGFAVLASRVSETFQDPKTLVFEDDRIYSRDKKKSFDTDKLINEDSRGLTPGLYKREKIKRYSDGTEEIEESYFAYGLISINTKKPLYESGEVTDFLLVVLDQWGYLVSDANITLRITNPQGEEIYLDTDSLQILESDQTGVYQASYLSEYEGTYNLYAEVEVDSFLLSVESFYNVRDDYEFDILRDVPATIDPWQGPFTNEFRVTPLNGFDDIYTFTEVFSSDFTDIETDADEIITEGDTTYLIWNNLRGEEVLSYTAQTPLVTPYLYYLGKSWINYSDQSFFENRTWLFAIDPAAIVCDSTSPCICGAACSGGGEPGDGTIDSCGDGDTTWEFVNDIRVTNLNGSFFGTGDTVEICVDFQTDSSGTGDRVSIGYKDASTNWVNGDVIFETREDNNNLNTHCVNQVLNNYVGTHHVRGKIVWEWNSRPVNDICDEPLYYDHDDINFTVLAREAAKFNSWDLDNGTDIGDGLQVIRGSNITGFSLWDREIQAAIVEHNGNGSFFNYTISSFVGNYTNYTLDTSDVSNFPNLGVVNVTRIVSNDFFFNLENSTTPEKFFEIFAEVRINETPPYPLLNPSVMYNGTTTTLSCQAVDNNIESIAYSNVNISFYRNSTGFLGSNLTNSTGWASISFVENNSGTYVINCSVSDELNKYYIAAPDNVGQRILTVKLPFADITIPTISNLNANPNLFSVGGTTTISANVTDDINLSSVFVNVTLPNSTQYQFQMNSTGGTGYSYTFVDTTQDGIYKYFVYAFDNSSNFAISSQRNFEVVGIRTYIGIESTKDVYKIGENIDLTSFTRTTNTNTSTITEVGDVSSIFYSFDTSFEGWTSSGAQDEWERGVPSDADLNTCESGNCIVTDLNANYNNNANNNIQSPQINMSGRTGASVRFWREIDFQDATNDRIFFESFDGVGWNILYQNTIGAENQEGAFFTYFPSEVEGVDNARFRFRMTSNGGGNQDGWAFDTFSLNFTPREDWNKSWINYDNPFGTDNNKTTAITIRVNITGYNGNGSDSLGTLSPDLQIQIFNGTSYSGSYICGLDSSQTYPQECSFTIKNTPEFLDPWRDNVNRSIRIRAVNMDSGDQINWTGVQREVVTPSVIENVGIAQVTSFLLQQFVNGSGSVVQTLYNQPVFINPGQSVQLDSFWSFSVPAGFTLGNYSAYVALTNALGNVLQNEDDGTFINDSYSFEVLSLIINSTRPFNGVENETYNINVTLETSFLGSGGYCGYSLDGAPNVSMTQLSSSSFGGGAQINQTDGTYDILFVCNDTDNDFIFSPLITFNVSEPPRIGFISPTEFNGSDVNQSWAYVNVSINDSTFNTSFLQWDGVNESMSCSFVTGITHNCFINKTSLFNRVYSYRVCANDSLNNIGCSEYRNIVINQTFPPINITSPLNDTKYAMFESIDFNVTAQNSILVFVEFNNNGTKYNLNNVTQDDWTFRTGNFSPGIYSVVFYVNYSPITQVNETRNFLVYSDSHIRLSKEINPSLSDTSNVFVELVNFGVFSNYSLHDFSSAQFSSNNFSQVPTNISSVAGPLTGTQYVWEYDTISRRYYNYTVDGTGNNYNLSNNYVVGIR